MQTPFLLARGEGAAGLKNNPVGLHLVVGQKHFILTTGKEEEDIIAKPSMKPNAAIYLLKPGGMDQVWGHATPFS